jgi:hypothetical protein
MLREMLSALDALPEKRLAAESLATTDGEYCALGALGRMRGTDLASIDSKDGESVAQAFGIAEALAAEIMYLNDEYISDDKWVDVQICGPVRPHYPEYGRHTITMRVPNEMAASQRFTHMRSWVEEQIRATQ